MFPFDLLSPRARILRQVRKRYGHHADAVMGELDRYSGSVVADRDRVQRGILELTNGSLENLKRRVDVALADYRDVLGPVESPNASTAEETRRINVWKPDEASITETSFAGLETDSETS